jgi:hypothetical protein
MPGYSGKPVAIGELIKDYIDKYPRKKELKQGMVLAVLPKVAGEKVNEQISKATFRNDKLILTVKNQIWRQEIHLQRQSLMNKLNETVNGEIVKEIVIYG